jgi:hypothetical protein
MLNLQKLGRAATLALILTVGMVASGPTLHASSEHSKTVLCGQLLRAIDRAASIFGADSVVVAYLAGQYVASCQG